MGVAARAAAEIGAKRQSELTSNSSVEPLLMVQKLGALAAGLLPRPAMSSCQRPVVFVIECAVVDA